MRRLAELGFTKLFNEIDMKEAARQGLLGLGSKPLDTEHIQAFLEDFGLDAEFGVHSRIRGLSGVLPICSVVSRFGSWLSSHASPPSMCLGLIPPCFVALCPAATGIRVAAMPVCVINSLVPTRVV